MKKCLSALLAMIMLLSVMTAMTVVPASAAVPDNYPYIYEDFETDPVAAFTKAFNKPGSATITANDFGVDENGNTVENGGSVNIHVTDATKVAWNEYRSKLDVSGVQFDQEYEVSVWARLNSDDTYLSASGARNLHFIIYTSYVYDVVKDDGTIVAENKTKTGWWQHNSAQTLKKGEWVNFTTTWLPVQANGGAPALSDEEKAAGATKVVIKDKKPTQLSLRICGVELSKQTGLTEVNVDFDNFSFRKKAVAAPVVAPVNDKTPTIDENFEGDTHVFSKTNTSIVSGVDGADGKCLKFEKPKTDVTLSTNATLKYNHLYHISYRFKMESGESRIKVDSKYTDNYQAADQAMIWWLFDLGELIESQPVQTIKIADGWVTFDYYVALNTIWAEKQFNNSLRIRISAGNDRNETVCPGVYYLDNFKIEDMGGFANGGFEQTDSFYDFSTKLRSGTAGSEAMGSSRTLKSTAPTGWSTAKRISNTTSDIHGDVVTTEVTNDVAPDSTGNNSLKVKVTQAGGSIYRGLPLETNKTYRLSFRAKGAEGSTINAVLDRENAYVTNGTAYKTMFVGNVPKEKYNAPDTQKLGDNWTLSSDWQTYSATFNTNFDLLETTPANPGDIARMPLLAFDVNGNAVGTEYYLDDVVLESVTGNLDVPVITNTNITSNMTPGSNVSVDYDFYSAVGATDASFVKVYADDAAIGTVAKGETFTLPNSIVGKTVSFKLVPATAEGAVGTEIALNTPAATGDWFVKELNGETVSLADSKARKVTVLFASYEGDELTDCKKVEAQLSANAFAEVGAPEDFNAPAGCKVKIYVWENMNSLNPLVTPAEYTK